MDDSLKVYADPNSWPVQFRGPLNRAADDCRWFAHLAREMQLDQRWRGLAETWEGFCQDRLGYPAEFVDAVIVGVRALGEDAPIPIEEAVKRGRAERIAESKRLVQEEGKSLRQAAAELGVSHVAVRKDLLTNSVMTKKVNSIRQRTVLQLNDKTNATTAAQKIREKFGDQFAKELKEAL